MYITGEYAAQELGGLDYSDPVIQASIDDAVAMASDLVDDYCHRTFATEDAATKYFDSIGEDYFDLDRWLLREATTVKYIDANGNESTLIEDEDYSLMPTNPHRVDGSGNPLKNYVHLYAAEGGYPKRMKAFSILGNWGCETYPTSIKRATLLTVKHGYEIMQLPNEVLTVDTGLGRMREFSETVIRTGLPSIAMDLLRRYKYAEIGFEG